MNCFSWAGTRFSSFFFWAAAVAADGVVVAAVAAADVVVAAVAGVCSLLVFHRFSIFLIMVLACQGLIVIDFLLNSYEKPVILGVWLACANHNVQYRGVISNHNA